MTDSNYSYQWIPYHGWYPFRTTQIDAKLTLPNGGDLPLDVWAIDDADLTPDMTKGANEVWKSGGVRFQIDGGLVNLVIPIAALTEESVEIAVRRFCTAAYGAHFDDVFMDFSTVGV